MTYFSSFYINMGGISSKCFLWDFTDLLSQIYQAFTMHFDTLEFTFNVISIGMIILHQTAVSYTKSDTHLMNQSYKHQKCNLSWFSQKRNLLKGTSEGPDSPAHNQ